MTSGAKHQRARFRVLIGFGLALASGGMPHALAQDAVAQDAVAQDAVAQDAVAQGAVAPNAEAPHAEIAAVVSAAEPTLDCSSPSAGTETDSSKLLDLALACYDAEHYDTSLTLLERLRSMDPNPVVAFNLGAAHAALGHCAEARHFYQEYLQRSLSESGKADAREQLGKLGDCSDAASNTGTSTSNPAASQPAPGAVVMRPPEMPSGNPLRDDSMLLEREPPSRLATWVLVGAGAALLAASGGFAYASERKEQAIARGSSRDADDVLRNERDGQRYNTLAWACAGGAVALASSGLLLLAFEPSDEPMMSLTKLPKARAWSVSLTHQF